jgi:membrane dipeptidase
MASDLPLVLSSAEEARARRVHDSAIVIDMVSMGVGGPSIFSDLPADRVQQSILALSDLGERQRVGGWLPYDLAVEEGSTVMRDYWDSAGLTCASFPCGLTAPALANLARFFEDYIPRLPWLRTALTAQDIRDAKQAGGHAMFANCQPSAGLITDLKLVERAYGAGLRSLMLTYNSMDRVGVGCTERVDAGLSNFGVDVVAACNAMGVIVDTSHCGVSTTLDACKVSTRPVTANHTAARGLYQHDRGKGDAEIAAIAATDGVIGVCFVPHFLAPGPASVLTVVDHIDYLVEKVGWRHVGLGTDWPLQTLTAGVDPASLQALLAEGGFREEHRIDLETELGGFADPRDLVNVTRVLVQRGYDDEQIHGVLGGNFLRVFEAACG